ncbi:MAG: BspA family leucine-rich repeat surface protein, partial [Pedobacter sp.]
RLVDVVQWGTSNWNSMESAFYGAANLKVSATDSPNLTEVSTMENTFRDCASLTTIPNINLWNTATVTNMRNMFSGAKAFNQDLSAWNTSNVINMEGIFKDATVFNQPLTNWNTAKVTTMRNMFNYAKAFDQDLSTWQWNKDVDLDGFLSYSGLNCRNLGIVLNALLNEDLRGVRLGVENLIFGNSAAEAYLALVNDRGWQISGVAPTGFDCENSLITNWDLSKTGFAGNNSISFFPEVIAETSSKYYWTSSNGLSGGGIIGQADFGTLFTITNLPQNEMIKLYIESRNLTRFAIANSGDKKRLMEVRHWGTSKWTSMRNAFYGASNLTISASDVPNLIEVRNMEGMFAGCATLNGPANIGTWNTSR